MQIIIKLHAWVGKVQKDSSSFEEEYSYLIKNEYINMKALSFPSFLLLTLHTKKRMF